MIDTSLDSSNFYFLIAVFQGVILALIIIFRNAKRKSNLFFGLLIFLFSLSLLHLILEESISAFNVKFPIPMEFGLSFGPLAYLHVLYIKAPSRKFTKRDFLHFLPSLLFDGILFSVVFVYFGNNLDWAYENILGIQSTALSLSLLGIVQLSIYTYLTYKESIEAKKVLRDFQGVRKWLKYLLGVWILLICFFLIAVPISLVFIENVDENSALLYKPLGIIIGGGIYLLGYLYIARYAKVVDNYIERISNFTFSAADLAKWKGNILHALEKEKLFRDAGITVGQLAKHLGLPINSLSHIINESFDTNFSDLINHHRILAFKELVLQPDSKKYSILGMGQEVGFSSKASFYRAFKKETGLTPSDYIKSQG